MKRLTVFKTSDGLLHEDFKTATRHADNRFGAALTSLAHKLCRAEGNYKRTLETLESCTDDMAEVLRLKQDLSLTRDDDDDSE